MKFGKLHLEPHLSRIAYKMSPEFITLCVCRWRAKSKMATTAIWCVITVTLLPNNVDICFWCLFISFSHPGNQFRAAITYIMNISQSYGNKTNAQIMYLNPVVHICFSPMLAHRLRRWPSIGPTYSNCVRTTTCKILLTHALTSPKFQKWTPTTNRVICWTGEKEVMGSFPGIYLAMFYQLIRCLATVTF